MYFNPIAQSVDEIHYSHCQICNPTLTNKSFGTSAGPRTWTCDTRHLLFAWARWGLDTRLGQMLHVVGGAMTWHCITAVLKGYTCFDIISLSIHKLRAGICMAVVLWPLLTLLGKAPITGETIFAIYLSHAWKSHRNAGNACSTAK